MEWLKVDQEMPDTVALLEAVKCLKNGGLVVFPTETFYGLAALANDPDAVLRIFGIKGRSFEKPLPVLVHSREQLIRCVDMLPDVADKLIAAFWPGALTIILHAYPELAKNLRSESGKVGFRISSHPVARELVRLTGSPITATSANFSGSPSVRSPDMLPGNFLNRVDIVLDCGKTPGEKASTVIDLTSREPLFLRKGSLARRVEKFLC